MGLSQIYKMKQDIYKKIIRAKGAKVVFLDRLPSDVFGQIVDNIIQINLKKNIHPAKTYLHEMIHYVFPDLPEKEVGILENKIWKTLNIEKRYKLYTKMFSST